ncbi:hypothetical protein MIC97_20815 [Aquamicrobium sp. NLF2-7]|uniref:hypothetical protein n=1 Tax=Aquamicrobium sp. NLF2-7 TaxID=2918753 RepID=UPI001EFBCB8B|nr:hypothetical protein [Aquamicrobium sp. NLF2-7]MCG8273929.1 hypothetical protein [Aquamicrobium sp. NLF2-7]
MPRYTIETTYHLPVYRHRSYDAPSVEAACVSAMEDEGWEDGKEDVDTSGETHITGIWEGGSPYSGKGLPVPDRFAETMQRKAAMFAELLALLREPAQPMGLSQHDFELWLPRARAVIARADAIADDRSGDVR